ncbi:MAG: hypothetical protein WDW36_005971 [Sanguina aurantia]
MLTNEEIEKMKVADLKSSCKEMGLDASGVKADLVARLQAALISTSEAKNPPMAEATLPPAAAADAEEAKVEPVEQQAPAAEAAAPAEEVPHTKHSKIVFVGRPSNGAAEAAKAVAVPVAEPAVVVKPVAAEVAKGEAGTGKTEAERKVSRAMRFKGKDDVAGTPVAATPVTRTPEDVSAKMKQRSARFETAGKDKPAAVVSEAAKLAQRAEKFSAAKAPAVSAANELEKAKVAKRAAKFAFPAVLMSDAEEIKKKARSERFKVAGGDASAPAAAAAAAEGAVAATEAAAAAAPVVVKVAVVLTPEQAELEAKKQPDSPSRPLQLSLTLAAGFKQPAKVPTITACPPRLQPMQHGTARRRHHAAWLQTTQALSRCTVLLAAAASEAGA